MQKTPLSRWKVCVVLGVLSCATHLVVTAMLHRNSVIEYLEFDESEYYYWAGELISGNSELSTRRPILHVATVGFLRWVTSDNLLGIRLGLASLFSLIVPLTFLLVTKHLGNVRAGIIASLLVLAWPLYLRFGGTLYSETTGTPLFMLSLILIPPGGNRLRSLLWLSAGLILGLATLSRAMYLIFIPFVGLLAVLEGGINRRSLAGFALYCLGWGILCIPWSVLISQQAGRFILISTGGGDTLAGSFNPVLIEKGVWHYTLPDGRTTWKGPGKWIPDYQTGFLKPEEESLSLAEKEPILRERTLAWMRANPGDVLYILSMKLLVLWGMLPQYEGPTVILLGNIPIMAVLALSLYCTIRLWRFKRLLVRFWIPAFYVSGVTLIGAGSWRYRQPADVCLLCLVALLFSLARARESLQAISDSRVANDR